ncbi:MAG: hypothetical protein WBE54_06880 [Bradyrhizobium sp.]
MSRHHIMPPAIYTPPPPKKIETKKRRIAIGMLNELEEAAETRESSGSGQPAPVANRLLQQNYPEIEGSDRKPRGPQGRLSQGTLSALLRVQEAE